MVSDEVRDELRVQVWALRGEVGLQTAEDVALAIVEGAAKGFLDITGDERREAVLRLLGALALDIEDALGAIAN